MLSSPADGTVELLSSEVAGSYRSITPDCPSAHLYERLINEQWKILPEGHPWLKPARFPNGNAGEMEFFSIPGGDVHEVAVGPVHAGVIEPGHFRFQCHGETVRHLEISLGYQHRGVENMLAGGPSPRTIHYMQTIAGDTTIGHTSAYCRILESLTKTSVPARAEAIRAIAAELERLANHIGDLGAMAGDTGFLPSMNYLGRIRGDVLNITAMLCGNRFGRNLVIPGGTAFDLSDRMIDEIINRLKPIEADTAGAVELMLNTPSVLARFEGTGIIEKKTALETGLVGVAARSCGIPADVRSEFPWGMYQFSHVPVCTWASGDCFARACVRWLEIRQSFIFVNDQLRALPVGPVRTEVNPVEPDMISVSMTEGWRGEICHLAGTGPDGKFAWYRIFDPSLHNWMGLSLAMRNQEISDFPLCNKSFNLSYCGHDL
jgi:Ni,Fe-hydrogenase III large subunit